MAVKLSAHTIIFRGKVKNYQQKCLIIKLDFGRKEKKEKGGKDEERKNIKKHEGAMCQNNVMTLLMY